MNCLSLDETRGRRKYIIIHTMVVKRAVAATVPSSSGDAGADKSGGNDFDLNMSPLLIVIVSLGYLRTLSVYKLFSRCVVVRCGRMFRFSFRKKIYEHAVLDCSEHIDCLVSCVPQMHCLVQDRTNCLEHIEHRVMCLGCLDGRPYRRKFNDAIHMSIHSESHDLND